MFRPNVWWWEGTVALRKIVIVALGVFGGSMGQMQIHVTGFVFFLNLMATAKVQPYADKTGILMTIEMACLSCVWCTLWAASVFNDHPRCEDGQGGYILWCNVVSGCIGASDVLVAASIPGVFVYLKWKSKKEKKKLKRDRSKSVQERELDEYEEKLSVVDQIEDPEERRQRYEEVVREREFKIRERMAGSDMMVNPSIEMAVRVRRTGRVEESSAAATNDEIVLSVAATTTRATSKTTEEFE